MTIKDSARYEVKMKALTVVQALDSYNAPIIDVFNVRNYYIVKIIIFSKSEC
ncbi:hypothetical protein FOC90_31410 (plasmid) [Bacillus thuringiensis]|nr:hypothetical protein FOC90_31410 [Bacillus thuringiensis]